MWESQSERPGRVRRMADVRPTKVCGTRMQGRRRAENPAGSREAAAQRDVKCKELERAARDRNNSRKKLMRTNSDT